MVFLVFLIVLCLHAVHAPLVANIVLHIRQTQVQSGFGPCRHHHPTLWRGPEAHPNSIRAPAFKNRPHCGTDLLDTAHDLATGKGRKEGESNVVDLVFSLSHPPHPLNPALTVSDLQTTHEFMKVKSQETAGLWTFKMQEGFQFQKVSC